MTVMTSPNWKVSSVIPDCLYVELVKTLLGDDHETYIQCSDHLGRLRRGWPRLSIIKFSNTVVITCSDLM